MNASRPTGFAAYRAQTERHPYTPVPERPMREAGELVWIHLGRSEDGPAVLDFAERLLQVRGDLTILITHPAEVEARWAGRITSDTVIIATAPDEHPEAVAAFLSHWQPGVALWIWGEVRPNLAAQTEEAGIPLHLVAADKTGFEGAQDAWGKDMTVHLMRLFQTASVRTAATATRLARMGMPPDRIIVQPPLRPSGQVLPYAQSDLDALMEGLKGRPVWLAADVQDSEHQAVIDAHRIAIRSAHRLLIIINPRSASSLGSVVEKLSRDGLSYAVWGDGQMPDETTQVLIADLPGELGLWYRVASLSFLGGTLSGGEGGLDPMVAASLGTAIVHGPYVGEHAGSYARLAKAEAARRINDSATLGSAIAHLIAPDQSALMAHAGWDVATEGAEAVDSVITLVQDSLDAHSEAAP